MNEEHFVGQVTQKAVIKYNDSFVIVREEGEDKWILPGGRLNVSENPYDGIKREIKEELSVEGNVENIISVDVYHGGSTSKTPKFFVFYFVSIPNEQEIKINNEIAEVAFITKREDLEKYNLYDMFKIVLGKFLD